MNTVDELTRLRQREPFSPFAIVLADGRQFLVDRPLQYAFTDDQLLFLDNRKGSQRAKIADILKLKLVAAPGEYPPDA